MKYPVKVGLVCLAICSALLVVVVRTGCRSIGGIGPNFALDIQNGYILAVCNADCVGVTDSEGMAVISPHIDRLNTGGSLVFGLVVLEEAPSNQPGGSHSIAGYFILDTSDGSVVQGLTKEKWLKELQTRGIQKEPKLIHPSFFFNWNRDR